MDTVRACIERHAEESPDRLFLIAPDSGQELSFAQLKMPRLTSSASNSTGSVWGEAQRVAFLMNNGYWTLRLFLGVMASNRIIVPLNAVAGTVQLVHVLEPFGFGNRLRRPRVS